MSNAVAGHGALVFIEVDPTGSPGVFTELPECNFDISPGMTRPSTNVTPHNDNDHDTHVRGTLMRNDFPGTLNYLYSNAVHTALKAHFMGDVTFGMVVQSATSNGSTDRIIWSGGLTAWNEKNPPREGGRAVDFTFRPSGPWKVDNVLYS
jgi:hypothetical protein